MKVLTNLKADVAEGDFVEPGVSHPAVGMNLAKGGFVQARLGPVGLRITNGKVSVAIPVEELVRLAVGAEPGLAPAQGSLEAVKPAPEQ